MADEKAAAKATTKTAAQEARYTVSELKEAAQALFGYGPEVVDGAFFGKDLTATYTVKEAQAAVGAFLAKPIKND